MKAAVYTRGGAGGAARIVEVERPVPKAGEVLLKVCAASVNPLDYHLRRLAPYLVRAPGRDVAGRVEEIGSKVTQFKPGDEVFGVCGAAFAEYACAAEPRLSAKPGNLSFEQAASVPVAGLTALQGLRDAGRIRSGQKVLVNGAAGGVGTFAVQVAKSFGAEVTGVCSARNLDLAGSIGADHVIDYARENFTEGERRYDILFDLVGNHSMRDCSRVLNSGGRYIGAGVLAGISVTGILTGWFTNRVLSLATQKSFSTFMAKVKQEDLKALGLLLAAGKVKPVIDRSYALHEVSEAIRYLAEKHARGKVVIAIA